MTGLYAPIPIAVPDDHPMFDGQADAYPTHVSNLMALDFATGRMYIVETDETGQICKVEECPT